MRVRKGLITALLSLAVSAGLLLAELPVQAAEEEYTYTVRFFAGQQGTINNEEMLVYSGLKYGERVTFDRRSVSLKEDSKYYLKGIRESGKDNNTVGATSFLVTEDRDYVVAYGLRANAVAYTVNYEDAQGNKLLESETFYGNVGDKPVVAYVYIEGYQPQAYNLTKTLSENAAENVFTFVYTKIPAATTGSNTGQTGTTGGTQTGTTGGTQTGTTGGTQTGTTGGTQAGTTGGQTGTAGDGQDEAAGDETEGTPQEEAGDDTPEEGGEDLGDENLPLAAPEETMDLDDGEVPLAEMAQKPEVVKGVLDISTRLLDLPLGAKVLIVLAFLAASGTGIWFFIFHKKRKKND